MDIDNKMGLIKKLVVAVACVFLAVLIMRNEYTGGRENKYQRKTVPYGYNDKK